MKGECELFMAELWSEDVIGLRRWDDGVEVVGVEGETLRVGGYEAVIERQLTLIEVGA